MRQNAQDLFELKEALRTVSLKVCDMATENRRDVDEFLNMSLRDLNEFVKRQLQLSVNCGVSPTAHVAILQETPEPKS